VAGPHNGVVFGHGKEQNPDLCHGLENIILNEKRHIYYLIPLMQNTQKRQIYRDRKYNSGFSGAKGRGNEMELLMGTSFLVR
jgi:hypothetical protein